MGDIRGMKITLNEFVTEEVLATIWDEPRYSPHRSKRLWKKLRKKTARQHPRRPACVQFAGRLIMHPEFYRQLQEQIRLAS